VRRMPDSKQTRAASGSQAMFHSGVAGDVPLGTLFADDAAHGDDPRAAGERRLAQQRDGGVRHGADRDQNELAIRLVGGPEDELVGGQWRRLRQGLPVLEHDSLVGHVVRLRREERLPASRGDGDVGAPAGREQLEGESRAHVHAAEDGGDAAQIELGRLERQGKGQRIVDVVADVRVEHDRDGACRHGPSLPA